MFHTHRSASLPLDRSSLSAPKRSSSNQSTLSSDSPLLQAEEVRRTDLLDYGGAGNLKRSAPAGCRSVATRRAAPGIALGTGCVGIHHPNGDGKCISFSGNPLTTVNNCNGTGGINTLWQVVWTLANPSA
jgi:hypothetical protein